MTPTAIIMDLLRFIRADLAEVKADVRDLKLRMARLERVTGSHDSSRSRAGITGQNSLLSLVGSANGLWGPDSRETIRQLRDEWDR